jgi:hypothetical protein
MKTAEPGANTPEASIPDGVASLESIFCADELRRRPWRAPDYATENRALVALNVVDGKRWNVSGACSKKEASWSLSQARLKEMSSNACVTLS